MHCASHPAGDQPINTSPILPLYKLPSHSRQSEKVLTWFLDAHDESLLLAAADFWKKYFKQKTSYAKFLLHLLIPSIQSTKYQHAEFLESIDWFASTTRSAFLQITQPVQLVSLVSAIAVRAFRLPKTSLLVCSHLLNNHQEPHRLPLPCTKMTNEEKLEILSKIR